MRNDPPGLGAYLSNQDRWGVCYDAANGEIEVSPVLFNKKYGTSISEKDWLVLVDEDAITVAVMDGLALERAEQLFDNGNGAGEDDPRGDR